MLRELLLERSHVYLANPPGSGIFSASGNHRFRPLDDQGRRLQSRALEDYRRLSLLLRGLLRNAPAKAVKTLDESENTIEKRIEQNSWIWDKTTTEAHAKVDAALTKQLALLGDLYDASGGHPVYVPDTNALLHNPDLDQWKFDRAKRFTVVLTPAVLDELDRLKVEHRNPDVRAKADALIGRIKAWRSRGDRLGRRDASPQRQRAQEHRRRAARRGGAAVARPPPAPTTG